MPDDRQFVPTRSVAGGPDLVRTPEEVEALKGTGEAALTPLELAAKAGEAGTQRRREAFDTFENEALTFAEGIIDALSMGFIHEPGPAADLRREVNDGSALLGTLTGTALGLVLPGPMNSITHLGRDAGRVAARSVLGDVAEGSRAALGVKAGEGAGEMAALMGAASIGHQTTDAILGDKQFSATAVVHEAGLGALLGGSVSLLSGMFGRAASKRDIRGQGDLLDPTSATSKALDDQVYTAIGKWDESLAVHEQRLGVLKQLEAEGTLENVVPEFMAKRELALAEARGAQKELQGLDFSAAMSGDEKAMTRWLKAQETYEAKLGALDDLMKARQLERIAPTKPGTPLKDPGTPVTENLGLPQAEVARMDRLMQNPEAAAAYEQLYGRPYEPQLPGWGDDAVEDFSKNLGGVETATSGVGTPMEKGLGARPPAPGSAFDRTRLPLQAEELGANEAAPLGMPPTAGGLPPRARLAGSESMYSDVQYGGARSAGGLPDRASLRGYTPESPAILESPPGAVSQPMPARAGVMGRYKATGPARTVEQFQDDLARLEGKVGAAPEGYTPPGLPQPGQRFSPTEWETPIREAELGLGRPIRPTRQARALDNVLSNQHDDLARDQLLLSDGYFGSMADRSQNAKAFAEFRQRMAGDTPFEQLNRGAGRVGPAPVEAPGVPGAPAPSAPLPSAMGDAWPEVPFSVGKTPVVPRGGALHGLERTPVLPLEGAPRFGPIGPDDAITPVRQITDVRPTGIDDAFEAAGTPVTGRERLRRSVEASQRNEGKEAVRRYLDEWYAQSDALGPRLSPGDYAAQEIDRSIKELQRLAGGRDVSAGATGIAEALRMPAATTSFGTQLQNLYAMRRLADLAADASKGTVLKAARKGMSNHPVIDYIVRRGTVRAAGKVGQHAVSGALGKALGPYGYFAGTALTYNLMGFAGRASGAAGRLYQKSMRAANALLAGKRATFVSAAVARDLSPNKPIAYSDAGPIKDPVRRIEELRRVASSPPTLADIVARAAGDLNIISPTFVEATVATVTAQLQFLSEVAPPLRYDQLGRPVPPSAGAMRKFLEAEAAVFNLDMVLDAVGRGQVTPVQVEALRRGHPAVYGKIAAFLMDDPAKLAKLERAKLKTVQMVIGAPLTPSSDPDFVARQQMSWEPEMPPGGGGPTQALSIPGQQPGQGHNPRGPVSPTRLPASKPTPSQSYSMTGRAPGN
jgi:hypothetical protein